MRRWRGEKGGARRWFKLVGGDGSCTCKRTPLPFVPCHARAHAISNEKETRLEFPKTLGCAADAPPIPSRLSRRTVAREWPGAHALRGHALRGMSLSWNVCTLNFPVCWGGQRHARDVRTGGRAACVIDVTERWENGDESAQMGLDAVVPR